MRRTPKYMQSPSRLCPMLIGQLEVLAPQVVHAEPPLGDRRAQPGRGSRLDGAAEAVDHRRRRGAGVMEDRVRCALGVAPGLAGAFPDSLVVVRRLARATSCGS